MKIRSSFVSNSSSSSFIVAVDKDVKEITATFKIDLSTITHKTITTIQQLQKYMLEDIAYVDTMDELSHDKYAYNQYLEGVKQLEAGKVLKIGYVTNEGDNDSGYELLLYDKGIKGLNSKELSIVKDVEI